MSELMEDRGHISYTPEVMTQEPMLAPWETHSPSKANREEEWRERYLWERFGPGQGT